MKVIDRYVLQNFRNSHSKAWNKRHQNWVVVMRLTGHGSGVSTIYCYQLGVDPDSYTFNQAQKEAEGENKN